MIRKYGKLIMMLICAAMVTACGSSQTAGPADGAAASGTEDPAGEEGTVDLAEKYSEIITHLENEEYDEAIEAINAMRPEPETETISITLDNWQEYFSFVDDYRYEYDAQGAITETNYHIFFQLKEDYRYEYDAQGAITETNYHIFFQLKEEYQDRLVSINGTVGYEYGDYVPHKVTSIDKENGSFEAEVSDGEPDDFGLGRFAEGESKSVELEPSIYICDGIAYQKDENESIDGGPLFIKDADDYSNQWIYYPEEINIVRIEGEMVLNK